MQNLAFLLSLATHSVGVIGGADGPTSILVASHLQPWVIISALLVLGSVLAFLLKKRKHKKGPDA